MSRFLSSRARLAISALEPSIIVIGEPCHRERDRFRDLRSIMWLMNNVTASPRSHEGRRTIGEVGVSANNEHATALTSSRRGNRGLIKLKGKERTTLPQCLPLISGLERAIFFASAFDSFCALLGRQFNFHSRLKLQLQSQLNCSP